MTIKSIKFDKKQALISFAQPMIHGFASWMDLETMSIEQYTDLLDVTLTYNEMRTKWKTKQKE